MKIYYHIFAKKSIYKVLLFVVQETGLADVSYALAALAHEVFSFTTAPSSPDKLNKQIRVAKATLISDH